MKIGLRTTTALFVLAFACGRSQKADPAACQKACSHVADLKTASAKGKAAGVVHEFDEEVDRQEEQSAKNIGLIKEQLASKPMPWKPEGFARLPARTQREVVERHQWEQRQLKQDRERAIQRSEENLAKAKKDYANAKAKAEAEGTAAIEDAFKSCSEPCQQRPASYAECLLRTQAVEDIEVCAHR